MTTRPLFGLVMAGGFSRRMGRDKATLALHGASQALWTARLLEPICERVFVSCREEQPLDDLEGTGFPRIHDTEAGRGPMVGILSAARQHPGVDWVVVACDLANLTSETLAALKQHQARIAADAIAFRSAHDGLPEPLCAIYRSEFMPVLEEALAQDRRCPRKLLIEQESRIHLLELPDPRALDNFNTPQDLEDCL